MVYTHYQGLVKEQISRLNLAIIGIVLAFAGLVGVATFAVIQASAANTTVTVYPSNENGWAFADDNGNGGSGAYVNGPGSPPLGLGSAQLNVSASNQGYILAKQGFAGTKISDLTNLEYSTYVQTGNNTIAPALQFNFDPDVTDAKNLWYSRVVYEPYFNGTVVDGTWQTWDALNTGAAQWWMPWNGNAATDYGTNPCPQANPCTLTELLAAFPNAGVRTDAAAAVLFKAGSGWNVPFAGNVDKFIIGTAAGVTTYDFEASAPLTSPSNKDACKNDGWKTFNNPVFKNQGQCVAFVERGPKTN